MGDTERTFFMIKPDGVHRNVAGEIIRRIERKGYKLVAMKLVRIDGKTAREHYKEHREKPFFEELVDFITSGPAIAMVVEGENAIKGIRDMMGKTNPADSSPGTIRGDFGINLSRNVVHGSDSESSAAREIGLFFEATEMLEYEKNDEKWIYP